MAWHDMNNCRYEVRDWHGGSLGDSGIEKEEMIADLNPEASVSANVGAKEIGGRERQPRVEALLRGVVQRQRQGIHIGGPAKGWMEIHGKFNAHPVVTFAIIYLIDVFLLVATYTKSIG